MPDELIPLVITRQVLSELDTDAVTLHIPGIEKLTYREAQQVMLLTALQRWIASYGLAAQFEINTDE
jgi:hypothetical protein